MVPLRRPRRWIKSQELGGKKGLKTFLEQDTKMKAPEPLVTVNPPVCSVFQDTNNPEKVPQKEKKEKKKQNRRSCESL